jgi:tRNA (adenine37-N6)-methyltransferase
MRIIPIGKIRTPYKDKAPYQPLPDKNDKFYIELDEEYLPALTRIEEFKYIYLIYYLHKAPDKFSLVIRPPWSGNKNIGLFASRSPARPNPIGLSVVKLKSIRNNKIYIDGIDAFDNTPLLDIKPYVAGLDSKADANIGWLDVNDDIEHLKLHIEGIPH